ncbi:hypothetical protein HN51_003973 [Arachis hypogaea]
MYCDVRNIAVHLGLRINGEFVYGVNGLDVDNLKQFWESACLADLYRRLCQASRDGVDQISGCTILLQSWAWLRLSLLCPCHICLTHFH